jgi:hypothetical protein
MRYLVTEKVDTWNGLRDRTLPPTLPDIDGLEGEVLSITVNSQSLSPDSDVALT